MGPTHASVSMLFFSTGPHCSLSDFQSVAGANVSYLGSVPCIRQTTKKLFSQYRTHTRTRTRTQVQVLLYHMCVCVCVLTCMHTRMYMHAVHVLDYMYRRELLDLHVALRPNCQFTRLRLCLGRFGHEKAGRFLTTPEKSRQISKSGQIFYGNHGTVVLDLPRTRSTNGIMYVVCSTVESRPEYRETRGRPTIRSLESTYHRQIYQSTTLGIPNMQQLAVIASYYHQVVVYMYWQQVPYIMQQNTIPILLPESLAYLCMYLLYRERDMYMHVG